VTALVRRPDALAGLRAGVTVKRADVRDRSSLSAALSPDIEVFVSVFGASSLMAARKVTDLYSAGTENLVSALGAAGIRRIVSVSSGGVVPQPNDGWFYRSILKPLFLKNMYADMLRMEEILQNSGLDWTVVRAPYLTGSKLTGQYRFALNKPIENDSTLSRPDLAHFLLRVCEEPGEWGRCFVALSY
jgi:putative NADH-flavin reductase